MLKSQVILCELSTFLLDHPIQLMKKHVIGQVCRLGSLFFCSAYGRYYCVSRATLNRIIAKYSFLAVVNEEMVTLKRVITDQFSCYLRI